MSWIWKSVPAENNITDPGFLRERRSLLFYFNWFCILFLTFHNQRQLRVAVPITRCRRAKNAMKQTTSEPYLQNNCPPQSSYLRYQYNSSSIMSVQEVRRREKVRYFKKKKKSKDLTSATTAANVCIIHMFCCLFY